MSMGDADAKFPGQHGNGLPPSPSRENPGQVFPQSDPKEAPKKSVPGLGGETQPHSGMAVQKEQDPAVVDQQKGGLFAD